MPIAERIREKVDRVGEKFPDQHERLSKCAEVVIERGADPIKESFEKLLDKILSMESAHKAEKLIDKTEHTIFESKIMSPFLGAYKEKTRARFWIVVSIGVVFIAAFAVAIITSLMRLH